MEELLSLKQEVTQLRKAAESNEVGVPHPDSQAIDQTTGAAHSKNRDNVLKLFKEQIQSLRVN